MVLYSRHLLLVHGVKGMSACEVCGVDVRDLKQHMREVHEKARILKCQLCEKAFVTAKMLKTHLKKVHEAKRATCAICSFQASLHMRYQ